MKLPQIRTFNNGSRIWLGEGEGYKFLESNIYVEGSDADDFIKISDKEPEIHRCTLKI